MRLRDKRALVTGGSRGLGRALCRTFAAEGARVAFTYSGEDPAAADAKSFRVSVLDTEGTERMVRELEEAWGGIDILVNNAGILQHLPLALLEEADWDRVMDVNVKGAFLTSRAVLRGMIRRRSGAILNIGSRAGVKMSEAPIHYCASKAAVVGLTQSLAKEVARYGIRVNCLAPGVLEDGVGRGLPAHRLADYLKYCSLGRLGTLEETARLAAFLVSDANSYMTGETVLMDGGV
ncbi:MAG: SDR family oxidoreductase [Planctomycetes bacterium]|nr:SDR family oxidoreductase [Planctomycetota bacterium]